MLMRTTRYPLFQRQFGAYDIAQQVSVSTRKSGLLSDGKICLDWLAYRPRLHTMESQQGTTFKAWSNCSPWCMATNGRCLYDMVNEKRTRISVSFLKRKGKIYFSVYETNAYVGSSCPTWRGKHLALAFSYLFIQTASIDQKKMKFVIVLKLCAAVPRTWKEKHVLLVKN